MLFYPTYCSSVQYLQRTLLENKKSYMRVEITVFIKVRNRYDKMKLSNINSKGLTMLGHSFFSKQKKSYLQQLQITLIEMNDSHLFCV